MDKIMQRWRKAVGSTNTRTAKAPIVEKDYLEPVVTEKQFLIGSSEYDVFERATKQKRAFCLKESKKFSKKMKKQESQDSNYFSEPEAPHVYEEIDEHWDYSEEDILLGLDKDKNTSTNNLILEDNDLDNHKQTKKKKEQMFPSLTDVEQTSLFASHAENIIWYYNLLCDKMLFYIQTNKKLSSDDSKHRMGIAHAHLLYVKNLYNLRIASSKQLKDTISGIHPLVVALALLLDSDAVRICESHTCSSDNYIYLFSTKIKYCSWKAKYYIILKRPKQSSIERLSLIEDVISCHKLICDKTIQ